MATPIRTRDDMQRRLPCRARDARATMRGGRACRSVRAGGFTLIELLVAIMLFAVMVGSALAAFPRRPYAVWTAQATVVAELRRTRNDALTKGTTVLESRRLVIVETSVGGLRTRFTRKFLLP